MSSVALAGRRFLGALLAGACTLTPLAPALAAPNGIQATAVQTSRTVLPGDARDEVFRLQLYNSNLLFSRTLTAVQFENRTSGPGTQAQLDQDWSTLFLADKAIGIGGTGAAVAPPVVVGPSATFSNGTARFSGLSITIAPLETVTLIFHGGASLLARDGDVLDLRIASNAALTFSDGGQASGSFPLDPAGNFPVNGMVAAQIGIHPIVDGRLSVGVPRQLVLDATIPANGYQADLLRKINLVNLGSAEAGRDLTAIEAWADDGDSLFDAAHDAWIGALAFTGERWELTGLNLPVPAGGRRMFVTADVAQLAVPGATVRLAFPDPDGSDLALEMASTNDGPIDAPAAHPFELSISAKDLIVMAADPIAPGSAFPGSAGVPLMTLVANNTYDIDKQLTSIGFTNATSGTGTQPQRDGELAFLTLREDGDDDGILGDESTDPVLGTAFFIGGVATFPMVDWKIAAGATRRLFLTGAVSLSRATDGDVLGASLAGPQDLEFADPTTAVAAWPVSSGAAWTVDGMVAAQITNLGAPGLTVAPGDGPVLALDLKLRRNGYADDLLAGFAVENRGTAGTSDLGEVHLWRDGGDGQFTGAGDDRDLGALPWDGARWSTSGLTDTLGVTGARLFVSVSIAAGATDSATVRLAVPSGGIEAGSGNDGPLDAEVVNPQALLVGAGPLLATLRVDPPSSALGQNVTATMTVRNAGSEDITGVAPTSLTASGTGALTPVSGPSPATHTLAPGEVKSFAWTYAASAAGDVTLTGAASGTGSPSGTPRSAWPVASNLHRVFAQADSVALTAFDAMPATVNRGQTAVVPLYLAFGVNDASAVGSGADVVVRSLRMRVESETGADIVPASLLSRVTVEGAIVHVDRTTLEASGSTVDLTLATPIVVPRGEVAAVAIKLDISGATTVPSFRVSFVDSAAFTAEDAVSGGPVTVRPQGAGWPVRSSVTRVLAAATELRVEALPGAPLRVGRDQNDITLLATRFDNPGTPGVGADVRVASVVVELRDTLGVRITSPGTILRRLRLRTAFQTHADLPISPTADSTITLVLSPLLSVPASSPVDVALVAETADAAALGTFRLHFADPALLDARDASTGAPVPVTYVTPPVAGPAVTVEADAETLLALGTRMMPPSVAVGTTNVPAMRVALRHPGVAGVARVRVDSVTVRCVDEDRNPLVPVVYVDRLRVLRGGVPIGSVTDAPAAGNAIGVRLTPFLMEPGDTTSITVVVDFQATAPAGTFELTLAATGLTAADANTAQPVDVAPDGPQEFPFGSGLTRLVPPARTLQVGFDDAMPAILAADGGEVTVGSLALINTAGEGSGTITVDRLELRAADAAFAAVALGGGAARMRAYLGGSLWAESAALTADSVTASLPASSPLTLDPNVPVTLELRMVTQTAPALTELRVGLTASGVGVVQPGSPLLTVAVQPRPGQAFPLFSETGGFAAQSLAGSYINFPNPFAAGRQATSFAYFLTGPARVSLRIWTAHGEPVLTLLDGVSRGPGVQQSDVWDGRNGRGAVVLNGVYVAELEVRYDSGATERLRRRVAVLR